MLEMAVLGLLKEQDMHGYELKKRLSDVFGVPSAVSFGSLYPALARLEAAGAVHAVAATAPALPGTGRAPARDRSSVVSPTGDARSMASRLWAKRCSETF